MVKTVTSSADNKEKNMNEYINSISIKCENEIKNIKKLEKIDENAVSIPTINCYNDIIKYNYNLNQLKSFAKHYGLKISGNKKELTTRIYTFLNLSYYIIKINHLTCIQRDYSLAKCLYIKTLRQVKRVKLLPYLKQQAKMVLG